jgi:hypothetical protein
VFANEFGTVPYLIKRLQQQHKMRKFVLQHQEPLTLKARNKKLGERVCLFGEEITAPDIFAGIERPFSFPLR